jgi:hypothetical protein
MHTTKPLAVVLMTLLVLGVGGLAAQPARPAGTAAPERTAAGELSQIVAFDNGNSGGPHPHRGQHETAGEVGQQYLVNNYPVGDWDFFDNADFTGTSLAQLGPGL